MSFTLYHYVHCPFCLRVRMALGYLNQSYISQVLPYDDEATPIALTGKKMLPILKIDGKAMNESLDIIQAIDTQHQLYHQPTTELENLLSLLGAPVHSLTMPYWIYTPEFTPSSRQYFQQKKEVKRGPFKDLVKKQDLYIAEVSTLLRKIEERLCPFYASEKISFDDILIAAHIWGLYIVPEFQFTPKLHQYLQNVKQICRFNYHQDFWR